MMLNRLLDEKCDIYRRRNLNFFMDFRDMRFAAWVLLTIMIIGMNTKNKFYTPGGFCRYLVRSKTLNSVPLACSFVSSFQTINLYLHLRHFEMIFGWFKVGFVKMRMCRRILLAILWVGFVIAGLHYFTGIQSNQDSQPVVVFGESLNPEHFSLS